MAVHIDLGKLGEELAVKYLQNNNFIILHRNWRHSYYEIDIIAMKDNLLHFVEVKIRSTNRYGPPEDSVTKKKIRFLLNAADEFLFLNPKYRNFKLDILSITAGTKKEPEYLLIEDVYL